MKEIINIVQKEIKGFKEIYFESENKSIILRCGFFYKIVILNLATNTIQIETLWNLGILGKILFKNKYVQMIYIGKSLEEKFKINHYQIICFYRNDVL